MQWSIECVTILKHGRNVHPNLFVWEPSKEQTIVWKNRHWLGALEEALSLDDLAYCSFVPLWSNIWLKKSRQITLHKTL
jgi:hypothetical protein